MTRKKVIPIVMIALIVLLAAAAIWFFTGTVRVLGPLVRMESETQCYWYDPDSDTVGDPATVTLSGLGCNWDLPFDTVSGGGAFSGQILISGLTYGDIGFSNLRLERSTLSIIQTETVFTETGDFDFGRTTFLTMDRSTGQFSLAVIDQSGEPSTRYLVSADSPDQVPELWEHFYVVDP